MIFLAIFILSIFITSVSIPSIIKLAEEKHLLDEPDERKHHKTKIPNLGGIAIFAGIAVTSTFFLKYEQSPQLGVLFSAIMILFFTGVKDDIIPLSPIKKLIAQLIACFMIVLKGGVRLTSLYGLFNIYEIPAWASIGISIFTILVIINSLNLIDGINGLAGGIASIIALTFGYWFYRHGMINYAIIAISLLGSLIGFLRFNLVNVRIFMGDTGSLLIGLVIAVLAIEFIEMSQKTVEFFGSKSPIFAVSVLIIPLFDTIRVFVIRASKGRSPMSADRNHIHHALVDLGLSHLQSSLILYAVNLLFVFSAYWIKDTVSPIFFLVIILLMAILMTSIPVLMLRFKNKKS